MSGVSESWRVSSVAISEDVATVVARAMTITGDLGSAATVEGGRRVGDRGRQAVGVAVVRQSACAALSAARGRLASRRSGRLEAERLRCVRHYADRQPRRRYGAT